MRENYLHRIEELKKDYSAILNQFHNVSGADIHNKTIDALIIQMNGIEMIINSIYIQAKANKITLNQ